ncbi:MAG TPA: hypothetical protein V6D25_26685, partial [Leptolyngbyaceae cyanobacterium]
MKSHKQEPLTLTGGAEEQRRTTVKRGRGAGSREQGGCSNGSCSPTNRERPGRAGLDTHVPLRFTALGQ